MFVVCSSIWIVHKIPVIFAYMWSWIVHPFLSNLLKWFSFVAQSLGSIFFSFLLLFFFFLLLLLICLAWVAIARKFSHSAHLLQPPCHSHSYVDNLTKHCFFNPVFTNNSFSEILLKAVIFQFQKKHHVNYILCRAWTACPKPGEVTATGLKIALWQTAYTAGFHKHTIWTVQPRFLRCQFVLPFE